MFEIVEKASGGTSIKVIGVGGAGGNAVDHMIREGVQGVDFITANTDAQALSRCLAPTKVQLGKTGLGAGSKPEAGRAAAQESRDAIAAALEGAHMCFITAGMGGGTGTGAAPIIAQAARELGVLTVGVPTMVLLTISISYVASSVAPPISDTMPPPVFVADVRTLMDSASGTYPVAAVSRLFAGNRYFIVCASQVVRVLWRRCARPLP